MSKVFKIIGICAAIGAAVGAIFIFREEIAAFITGVLDKLSAMRGYNDVCFDDSYDDFDDFDDPADAAPAEE